MRYKSEMRFKEEVWENHTIESESIVTIIMIATMLKKDIEWWTIEDAQTGTTTKYQG